MASTVSISQALANKVAQSVNVQPQNIYQYEPQGGFSGYPAVTITLKDLTQKFADTARMEEHYMFSVKVYNEFTEQTAQTAETNLRTTTDELITLFNADPQLGTTLTNGYSRTEDGKTVWTKGPNIEERMIELIFNAYVIQ
ncbi:MAG TPA: hypothetical protein VNX65_02420 [Patescibacteria group bacterium]|jgi:hypothetical protein|nr:hypothetical protein [Patescibacteria group bacterium]